MSPPGAPPAAATIRLVLVRHGESDWNAAGIVQGHRDSALTPLGHAQARAAADWLVATYPDPVRLVRSDLGRVAATAAPAEQGYGRRADVDAAWREVDVGTWSGRTRAQIAEHDPDGFAAWRDGADVTRGGRESLADLQARVWPALERLAAAAPPDAAVVVFTHGGPVRVAVAAALGVGVGWQGVGPAANGSVTELDVRVRDGQVIAGRLASYNRTPDAPA